MLLDGKLMVATSAGFAMTLSVNSTYSVDISSSLKMDVQRDFFKSGDATIIARLQPKMAVQVDGSMIVDSFFGKDGVKASASVRSNTNVDASVRTLGYRLATAEFNVPEDVYEVFDASFEFLSIRDDRLEPIISGLEMLFFFF